MRETAPHSNGHALHKATKQVLRMSSVNYERCGSEALPVALLALLSQLQ